MDPLEVLAKHRRLERKHRRVEKELADLKAAVAKNPSETPPPPVFFLPPSEAGAWATDFRGRSGDLPGHGDAVFFTRVLRVAPPPPLASGHLGGD